MALLLSAAAAAIYGGADFLGGLVTRRTSALSALLVSQLTGMSLLLIAVPLFFPAPPHPSGLWWGAASGVAGGGGVALLWQGLSRGRMSVVAPIAAALAAVLPVLFGISTGERPGALALAGVALAVPGVALVSRSREPAHGGAGGSAEDALPRSGLREAFGAGICFGLYFLLLDQATPHAGMWPLVGSRLAAVVLAALVALPLGQPLRPARGTTGAIAAAGALDTVASVCYLLALRQGLLSLVAVVTSMYPASTVALARFVLGERVSRSQLAGLACVAVALALIGTA